MQFLCAIARPRFNTSTGSWFDGKIGIWPIGEWAPALQLSRNHPRGTPVWNNHTITHELYRDCLIQKLIPAIVEKWPVADRANRKIMIQQDGAKSHFKNDDAVFLQALQDVSLNAEMITQPTNSPDLNMNDLGFFGLCSLQMMRQWRMSMI